LSAISHIEYRPVLPPNSPSVEDIWKRYDEMEHRLASPLSQRMLDLLGLAQGQKVLDVATGRGEPAIPAAHRVGIDGNVIGIDLSESMLAMARDRARLEGLQNVTFQVGDAQTLCDLRTHSFDHVLARWCLMYFASPMDALRNAHRVLKPGGFYIAAVWAEPERVSYYTFPRSVLAKICPISETLMYQNGPFAYASQKRIENDVCEAGLEIVHMEDMNVDVMQANTADELIEWTRCFGMNRLLKDQPVEVHQAWTEAMRIQSEQYRILNEYRLGGTTRLVLARKAI
jgi:ubiquinone/menaquinone biosynthesis C-methylase UbiE